jgi:hypothetical protein
VAPLKLERALPCRRHIAGPGLSPRWASRNAPAIPCLRVGTNTPDIGVWARAKGAPSASEIPFGTMQHLWAHLLLSDCSEAVIPFLLPLPSPKSLRLSRTFPCRGCGARPRSSRVQILASRQRGPRSRSRAEAARQVEILMRKTSNERS